MSKFYFLPKYIDWIRKFLSAVVISTALVNKNTHFWTFFFTEPCNVLEIHLDKIMLVFHNRWKYPVLGLTLLHLSPSPTFLPAVMDTLWFSADSWLPHARRGSTRAMAVITHLCTCQSLEEPEEPPGKKRSRDTTGSFMQEQSGVCVKGAQELKHHALRICPCFSYLL